MRLINLKRSDSNLPSAARARQPQSSFRLFMAALDTAPDEAVYVFELRRVGERKNTVVATSGMVGRVGDEGSSCVMLVTKISMIS